MINNLFVIFFMSLMKFLYEDNVILILMSMEMISLVSLFNIFILNPEVLTLTSCTITLLTLMISESVLSLAIFISLMRHSSEEGVSSMSLSH